MKENGQPDTRDKCEICGADYGLHHANDDSCPANGQESGNVGATGWLTTRFTPVSDKQPTPGTIIGSTQIFKGSEDKQQANTGDDVEANNERIRARRLRAHEWLDEHAKHFAKDLQGSRFRLMAVNCMAAFAESESASYKQANTAKHTPERKPISAKPQLYAFYFETLKKIAGDHGYNLVIDGSMARDFDVIAFPWSENPRDEFEMIQAFDEHLTCKSSKEKNDYLHSEIAGRKKYVIDLDRGGYLRNGSGDVVDPIQYKEDPQYYIDISVIAPATAAELQAAKEEIERLKDVPEGQRYYRGLLEDRLKENIQLKEQLSAANKRVEELLADKERLEKENAGLVMQLFETGERLDGKESEVERLAKRVEELTEALKPFALLAGQIPDERTGLVWGYNSVTLTVENFRSATLASSTTTDKK